MSKLRNLEDLFIHELRDLYSAENQLVKAMPKMAKEANDPQLVDSINLHLDQTKEHVKRLEQVFEILGKDKEGETCKAMEGLIKEGESMIDENATPETKDAGLIATAQRIEHYEISGYGTAAHFAERLGHQQVLDLLKQTLSEEKNTDEKLNQLAKSKINKKAM
ncbi:MAG: ferritin-like domain-containing protein [Hymenobacteraceae bacterium]|nr:ferritin-like domain-containing protein [Hymenobacteraceae bacterium]MDX5395694.1 ferritin-like domain-containing protein [Hymenobacteraceae bacterium]MDX5442405.1 ferritin-like domain-containing protein [Hymenobacteraceae bacterium]MDX5511748.1 ferritin-like domain-containing protein [Hymenobacteraceae bacterium]